MNRASRWITYYGIKPQLPQAAPISLFAQDQEDELFLGPHVRLCGFSGMAHIESSTLAYRYAEACTPFLQKRYGNETKLEVVIWESVEDKKLAGRIEKDSEIIRKRLVAGNFSPNKAL
ncbi:hypothetical protein ABO04_05850 [Nitrosomonas sp. HPC101]|uniref:hypothetical protein n=1 Tax=Nitrosomonas sp. HPC101 TaxID=1658667 RepID=UPI001369045E|nr:hypothetical protein [Nitrosomonas sp. HPC101]MXS85449.1 hypothetical protein [Nitrosomonas sp. HPC101]